MRYVINKIIISKAPIFLAVISFVVAGFLSATHTVSALTMAEILNQPKVLGAVTANPYPFPTGSLVSDGGTIYFIGGTIKIPFTNYKAFTGLGYLLKNVRKGDLSNYTVSQAYQITTANAAHPWGSWLGYKGIVYFSAEGGMIPVPSAEIFLANGGKWDLVVKANKYDVAIVQTSGSVSQLALQDNRISNSNTVLFSGAVSQSNNETLPVATTATTATSSLVSLVPQIVVPANIYASTTAAFGVISADPDIPLLYNFSWGDGSRRDSASVNSLGHTYYTAGAYTMAVQVINSHGNMNSATTTFNVTLATAQNPSAPQITIPSGAKAGTEISVTASASDPQGLPLNYLFSWGDGTADTFATIDKATHTYSYSETFPLKVTVTNTQGLSSSRSSYVYILP